MKLSKSSLGAPVLTTETFSSNSQRALFQRVVKTKRKPTTVLMKLSKSSLKPEPKSRWNLCFHKVTGSKTFAKLTTTTSPFSRTTSTVLTAYTPSTCSTKDARLTVLNSMLLRIKLSDATTNMSAAKSLLNSDNALPPVRPVSTLSTPSCTFVPTDTSLATKNNSKNFV